MREMAKPMPVVTGSEYRERNTMRKQVKEKIAGMNRGTCERKRIRKKERKKKEESQIQIILGK